MKFTNHDTINEPTHKPPQKVIEAIIQNGAGAVTIRQAVRAGLKVRDFKQALKMHNQIGGGR